MYLTLILTLGTGCIIFKEGCLDKENVEKISLKDDTQESLEEVVDIRVEEEVDRIKDAVN